MSPPTTPGDAEPTRTAPATSRAGPGILACLGSLAEVRDALPRSGAVAHVGCGVGRGTLRLARTFPQARFLGLAQRLSQVHGARRRALRDGLAGRVSFEHGSYADLGTGLHDLVLRLGGLSDLGDPVGAARGVACSLAPGGVFVLAEPLRPLPGPELPRRPLGPCPTCLPPATAALVGVDLGPEAREARLREVLARAGFPWVLRLAGPAGWLTLQARR